MLGCNYMERIKVGVVGVGYLGDHHARVYSEIPSVELVGVADTDRKRAEEVAQKFNTTPYVDYRDLIGKVNAVSIVVPTVLHHEVAIDFIKNGVDILLEKPITRTIPEARNLIKEADKKSLILQIGHLERFNAAFRRLKGILTTPLFIESYRLSPFPERGADVDVILDLMIHDIDIALSLMGSEISDIRAVGIPVLTSKVDIANVRIEFRSGCVANLTSSRVSKEKMRKLRIFQPEAYISLDYQNQELLVFKRILKEGMRPEIEMERVNVIKGDSLKAEIEAFIDSVKSRKAPLVSGKEGLAALTVAQKIIKKIKNLKSSMLQEVFHAHTNG